MNSNIQDIKSTIESLSLSHPNITSIGYGYKMVRGQQTDDLAIVYSVKEKKPLSELSLEEIIPSIISINGNPVKTDVIVIENVELLVCNAGCADGSGSAANRVLTRPLQGGLSVTSKNNVSTKGTMGFIAVDVATQALVGVTNNHVTIKDPFFTSQRNLLGILENDYTPTNDIYQDGESGTIPPSNYVIGQSVRYVPILEQGNGINYADVAMFSLKQEDIDIATSFKQIGESYNQPLPFATTSELDNLLITNPMLYSSGRTTGPKGGASCPLRVSQIAVSTIPQFNLQGTQVSALFADTIRFVKPINDPIVSSSGCADVSNLCINPIRPGDSGSALIADFDGVRKIIGIVFAASTCGGDIFYGYACRIDRVAQELGIQAWDGTAKNYIDPSTIEYITTFNGSGSKTITCNTKTYWQAGLTNLNNPCI